MTDLSEVMSLLDRLGIGYKIKEDENIVIKIKQGYENVGGYNWFYATFDFDASGKFIEFGVWE